MPCFLVVHIQVRNIDLTTALEIIVPTQQEWNPYEYLHRYRKTDSKDNCIS